MKGHLIENKQSIVNSGSFFKVLRETTLVWKGKQAKGGKEAKQRFTIASFVSAADKKIDQPTAIWEGQVSRCF